jgi:hypothetical protein
MKIKFLAVFVLLFLASAAVVHADTIPADPKMAVTDPFCEENCGTFLDSTSFTFSSNASGGGFLSFVNASGVDWTSLLIETGSDPFNVPANTVTCETNAFSSCVVQDLAGGITSIYLSGLNGDSGENGVPSNFQFFINLNDDINQVPNTDPNGSGGWGANRLFTADANVPAPSNPVPEPATLTLVGIGIGALVAKKKLRG